MQGRSRLVKKFPSFSTISKQLGLLEKEECILVDRDDHQVGVASKRKCHYMVEAGNVDSLALHRAFSIFLFNPNDGYKMLLQQRALCKVTFPGIWSNTCCSHPLVNHHNIIDSMQKKLEDELGIPIGKLEAKDFIFLGKIHYKATSLTNPNWGEHELDHLYAVVKDLKVNFNPEEVSAVRWVNPAELELELRERAELYSPWFKAVARDYILPLVWNQIQKPTALKPPSQIMRYPEPLQ